MISIAIYGGIGFLVGVAASHFIGAVKLAQLKAVEDSIIAVVKAEIAKIKL